MTKEEDMLQTVSSLALRELSKKKCNDEMRMIVRITLALSKKYVPEHFKMTNVKVR